MNKKFKRQTFFQGTKLKIYYTNIHYTSLKIRAVTDLTIKLKGVNFFEKNKLIGVKKIKGGQFQFYNLKICIILKKN